MSQFINLTAATTKSLATGASTLYAIINNSGSSLVTMYDATVNPLAPTNGKLTGSATICSVQFNAQPVKVDYGVRASKGLVAVTTTDGNVTIIYE